MLSASDVNTEPSLDAKVVLQRRRQIGDLAGGGNGCGQDGFKMESIEPPALPILGCQDMPFCRCHPDAPPLHPK